MSHKIVEWVNVRMPVLTLKVKKNGQVLTEAKSDFQNFSDEGKVKFVLKGFRTYTDPIGSKDLGTLKAKERCENTADQLYGRKSARFGKGGSSADVVFNLARMALIAKFPILQKQKSKVEKSVKNRQALRNLCARICVQNSEFEGLYDGLIEDAEKAVAQDTEATVEDLNLDDLNVSLETEVDAEEE